MRQIGKTGLAEEFLQKIDKIDSISARMVLLEAYETTYRIYNHEDPTAGPLAAIAMHPREDTSTHSALYNTIRRFRKYRVGHPDNFNMSLNEFMALPKDICDFMMELLSEEAKVEAARLNDQINKMKNQ